MKQKRAYQYRWYPTDEQQQVLARTFGCVRYIYNWGLRKKTDAYYQQGERLSYAHLSCALTDLKKQDETAWLNEVSSVPLQQTLRHLDRAFLNFFEGRAKYPTFKKKHGVQSASYAASAFKWDGVSSYANWTTRRHAMDGLWSRLTSGTRPPNDALIVVMFWKPFRLISVSGPVPNVRRSMIVMSTPQTISLPLGWRCMPVERV